MRRREGKDDEVDASSLSSHSCEYVIINTCFFVTQMFKVFVAKEKEHHAVRTL